MRFVGLCLVVFPLGLGVLGWMGQAQPKSKPLGPIAYFEARCARCHGAHGSFYGDDFGKGLSDHALREKIIEMAAGPGGAPLKGRELDAQVAYHRALILKQPFLVMTELKGSILLGEVSPGASVEAQVAKRVIHAKVSGTDWSLILPAKIDWRKVLLIAKLGKAQTRLPLSQSAFSHIRRS